MKKNNKKLPKLLSFFAYPFYSYYKFLNFNKTIAISALAKNGVEIFGEPSNKNILYVIKLESNNNYYEKINLTRLKSFLRHLPDANFSYFFIKNPNFQVGYIASFSKDVIVSISDQIGLPILSPVETIQFLFDIYKVAEYRIDEDQMTIIPTVSSDNLNLKKFIDPMLYNTSQIFKEGAYLIDKNYKLFQTIKYINKKDFNYIDNFQKNFDGIIQIYVDLSDNASDFIINNSLRYAKMLDKEKIEEFEFLRDENKNGNLETAVVNSIILAKDSKEAYNSASSLGWEVLEKNINKSAIVAKTFLKTRDMDYDALLPLDYLENLIGIRTKKVLTPQYIEKLSSDKKWVDIKIDFMGRDLFNAPTNFCFRANENPHAVIIGDAGTGKSVSIQKILKSILRLDLEKNEIKRFKEVKTRYYEIGGSSDRMLRIIKDIYPNDVGIINGTLDGMRFNVVDIKVMGESDENPLSKISNPILDNDSLAVAVNIISVILEETGEDVLTSSEESILINVIKDVYRNKKYRFKTIQEIENMGEKAYAEFIERVLSKGYSKETKVNEIEGVRGINKFQKPTIRDIMQEVNKRSNAVEMSQIDKETHHMLYRKLKAVSDTKGGIFGSLSSIDFNDKQFYSFEFNQVKEDQSLLRIIFTFLFLMVYKKDIEYAVKMKEEGKVMPQVIYIFEESRNFIHNNKSIARMLEKAVFEGRKFQIHALFVAQQIEHIPLNIIKGCSTFMFLMPRSKEKRIMLAKDIENLYPKQDTIKFLVDNIPFRALGIISSQGVGACKFDLSDKELKLFAN